MAQNPATPQDLINCGYPVSETQLVETTRLGQSWRALIAEVPSIPARIDAATLDVDTVVDVVVSATLRVLRNPDGHRKVAAGIDDYREDIELADSTEDIYFTSAELRRLTPPVTGAGSMAYM